MQSWDTYTELGDHRCPDETTLRQLFNERLMTPGPNQALFCGDVAIDGAMVAGTGPDFLMLDDGTMIDAPATDPAEWFRKAEEKLEEAHGFAAATTDIGVGLSRFGREGIQSFCIEAGLRLVDLPNWERIRHQQPPVSDYGAMLQGYERAIASVDLFDINVRGILLQAIPGLLQARRLWQGLPGRLFRTALIREDRGSGWDIGFTELKDPDNLVVEPEEFDKPAVRAQTKRKFKNSSERNLYRSRGIIPYDGLKAGIASPVIVLRSCIDEYDESGYSPLPGGQSRLSSKQLNYISKMSERILSTPLKDPVEKESAEVVPEEGLEPSIL